MSRERLRFVLLGLSITSSWGNGHATTYRGLVRELARRGHDVLFLERDVPWYRNARDLPHPSYARIELYRSVEELRARFGPAVREADIVIQGSFVPDGVEIGHWLLSSATGLTAFYDIDTPVTLSKLAQGDCEYLSYELVPRFDLYLSFTGGPLLRRLESELLARRALPLYCSVEPDAYRPLSVPVRWDLGYMGTYSPDRQLGLKCLLFEAAKHLRQAKFAVAGPQYPKTVNWPESVERLEHLPPSEHCGFYNAQRFTLNLTRRAMRQLGYSPSVRLFEAAACGTPIISDAWDGLSDFFRLDEEILVARSHTDVLRYLTEIDETERRAIGTRARQRILAEHTAARRAEELLHYLGAQDSHRFPEVASG